MQTRPNPCFLHASQTSPARDILALYHPSSSQIITVSPVHLLPAGYNTIASCVGKPSYPLRNAAHVPPDRCRLPLWASEHSTLLPNLLLLSLHPVAPTSFVLNYLHTNDIGSVENCSVVTKVRLLYSTTKIRSCLCKLLNMKPIRDEFSTLPLKEYGEKSKEVGKK